MSDDFGNVPNPDEFEFDSDGFYVPHDPKFKRDDPRKRKTGRTFDWTEIWIRAIRSPTVTVYREHLADPQASFSRAITWMFATSVVGAVLQAIANSMASVAGVGAGNFERMVNANFSVATALCCAPFVAILGIIGFIIFNGIQYIIAILLGGQGRFEDQVYSVATYAAPLSLIMGGVGMIPCLGPLAVLGVMLYALFLNVVSLEAVHMFDRGRAIIASLGWILLFCLCPIILLIMLAMMGVAISSNFQNIIGQIITPTPSVVWTALRYGMWAVFA